MGRGPVVENLQLTDQLWGLNRCRPLLTAASGVWFKTPGADVWTNRRFQAPPTELGREPTEFRPQTGKIQTFQSFFLVFVKQTRFPCVPVDLQEPTGWPTDSPTGAAFPLMSVLNWWTLMFPPRLLIIFIAVQSHFYNNHLMSVQFLFPGRLHRNQMFVQI